jgi:hypothetical protein
MRRDLEAESKKVCAERLAPPRQFQKPLTKANLGIDRPPRGARRPVDKGDDRLAEPAQTGLTEANRVSVRANNRPTFKACDATKIINPLIPNCKLLMTRSVLVRKDAAAATAIKGSIHHGDRPNAPAAMAAGINAQLSIPPMASGIPLRLLEPIPILHSYFFASRRMAASRFARSPPRLQRGLRAISAILPPRMVPQPFKIADRRVRLIDLATSCHPNGSLGNKIYQNNRFNPAIADTPRHRNAAFGHV